jgi:hypothetical protein
MAGNFSRLGVAGNSLMILYLVIVTFFPSLGKIALLLAMPGGLMIMVWMISFTIPFSGCLQDKLVSPF